MTEAPRRTESRVSRSWWPGWIWAVPLAALGIVVWLAVRAFAEGGEDATLTFSDAHGISKTDTKVVYRGVDVGEVTQVGLDPDLKSVRVVIHVRGPAAHALRAGTKFWLIGAHPSLSDLSDLKGVLTGPSIGMAPGSGPEAHDFRGLEEDPSKAPLGPQIPYLIRFHSDAGALKPGAPVLLRGFRVGSVARVGFRYDGADGDLYAPVVIRLEPARMGLDVSTPAAARSAADAMVRRLIADGLTARIGENPPIIGAAEVELEAPVRSGASARAPAGRAAETADLGADGESLVIPASGSAGLQGLEGGAQKILARIDAIPIEAIGRNIAAASAGAKSVLTSPRLSQTLRRVDLASQELDGALRDADQTVRRVNGVVSQVSPQISPLVAELKRAAADADRTVSDADKLVGGDPTLQTDLPGALQELADAARAVRVLADTLERHPEALIKGKPKP